MRIIESSLLYLDRKNKLFYLLHEGPYDLNGSGLIVAIATGPLKEYSISEFKKNGLESILHSLSTYKNRMVLDENNIPSNISPLRNEMDRKLECFNITNREAHKEIWITDRNDQDLKFNNSIENQKFFSDLMNWLNWDIN